MIITTNNLNGVAVELDQGEIDDLLSELLELWIKKGKPPDVLSREHSSLGPSLIRFEWLDGSVRVFPYTDKRYRAVWFKFNNYWRNQDGKV